MNESTLIQLKILVERAVRPVRASEARKRTMREELLSHVGSVFEEEFAGVPDQEAALAKTAQRFGDPGEVTRSLQGALPRIDRLDLFVDEMWLQPGESVWRRAVRHTLVAAALFAFFPGLVLALLSNRMIQSGLHADQWPLSNILKFSGWSIWACAFLVAASTFGAEWVRRRLRGGKSTFARRVAFLLGVGPLIMAVVVTVGIAFGVLDNFWIRPTAVVWLFLFGLATSAILFSIAQANERRMLHAEEWTRLPIEL